MTLSGEASPGLPSLRPATRADFDPLMSLLKAAELPTAGIPPGLDDFYVAEIRGRIVAGIGLEVYGRAALLRSAVVDPLARGKGTGGALVHRVLDHARERGVSEVFLLTTTADRYFPKFGFVPITRDAVPDSIRMSVEFREACPASASAMRKEL